MKSLVIFLLFCFTFGQQFDPASAANYLGNGFDFSTGTYSLAPIFMFTYDANATWTSPYSKKIFSIPDQMYLHPLDKTFESVTQHVWESYQEFYESLVTRFSFSVGIDTKVVGFGFHYDRQSFFVHDALEENYIQIVHGTHWWSFNIGSLYPAEMLPLNPMFKIATEKFPQKINTQTDINYATEYTDTFGQFFVYRSVFGAEIDFNIAITETLKKSYSKEWISTQAGFSFHYYLFNVSAGSFENRTDIHIDNNFLQNSNCNTSFYGGDPSLADIKKLDQWVFSIDQNLYPLNSTFVPIWSLVSDPIKQETMKNFMMDYIKKHNNH